MTAEKSDARERMWVRRLESPTLHAVLVAVVGAFFLTYFNRFVGLRSGDGEYTGGVAFLHGALPYRDYFTTAPPFNLLKSALLQKLFGSALIVNRVAGVAERILLSFILFRWLRAMFLPMPALVAAAVTLIVSAGDRTDPIASYNHDAILFAMLSGWAASLVVKRELGTGKTLALAGCSGCCAALGVLTKQTVGLGSACTVLAVTGALLWRLRGLRAAARWMAVFVAGCLLPLLAVCLALARLHLLRAFLGMLFVKGPAAKAAHASDFLMRDLLVARDNFGWLMLGSFALLLSWRALGRWTGQRSAEVESGGTDFAAAGWVLLGGLGLIGLAETLRGLPALHDFSKSCVYFTLFGLTAVLIGLGRRLGVSRRRLEAHALSEREAQSVLFCSASWAVAFTLSLSWPAFEAMVLPGLGFLLAAALEGARRRALPWVYAALALTVWMQAREKLDLPFGFDYQEEGAVRAAFARSAQPQLRGMRLPEQTVLFLDETVATIKAHTREGDTIFVYPEMGLLYALSGRMYPTLSGSHNIDVVNDAFAAEEAQRLRRARPAVIVYYRLTDVQQRDAERLWRRGRPSGQRVLAQAVEELVREFRLTGRYRLRDGDPEILVYVRE